MSTTWNINVIGDQSLDITNGDIHLYKERDELSGDGVYVKKVGYTIPTLPKLWEELSGISEIDELYYSDFKITRYQKGFVFELESGYKDVVSDETAHAQDLLSFFDMLDQIMVNNGDEAMGDHKKLSLILNSLDTVLKPKGTYEH